MVVPVTRPVSVGNVVPLVQADEPVIVMGNWPSTLAVVPWTKPNEAALGPNVPVQVALNAGMYCAWRVVEARAQEPPAMTAVPLPTVAPEVLVMSGSRRVEVAVEPTKAVEVSVRTLLLGLSVPVRLM